MTRAHRLGALHLKSTALAAALLAATAGAQQQPPEPVDPLTVVTGEGQPEPVVEVHDELHHRQVFQRGPMRILELQVPPGDRSWYHRHLWPVLYVTFSSGGMRTQNWGDEGGAAAARGAGPGGAAGAGRGGPSGPGGAGPGAAPRGAGPGAAGPGARAGGAGGPRGGGRDGGAGPSITSTTSYVERPVTHRVENNGTRLLKAMVVINETQGNDTVSVEAAGFSGEPALTNAWFRAYRFTLAPGESASRHNHNAPAVIIQTSAGRGEGRGAATFEFNEPGQWAYFDPGDAHVLVNLGDTPLELVEVEVRL